MSTTPSTDEIPAEVAAVIARGEPVWDTQQLTTDFEVQGFLAPYVVVRRRADGAVGTLTFTHRPRFYFGWVAD